MDGFYWSHLKDTFIFGLACSLAITFDWGGTNIKRSEDSRV